MPDTEGRIITLPSDMAAAVSDAVAGGDDASSNEVVRDALRDWKVKRALQCPELAALEITTIDRGLADLAAGRVKKISTRSASSTGGESCSARPLPPA